MSANTRHSIAKIALITFAMSVPHVHWLAAQDVAGTTTQPTPETPVAGRTLEQWVEACGSENRVTRLRAIKTLGVYGAAALPALTNALESADPAVQYTALVHWGRISQEMELEPTDQALEVISKLKAKDDQPALQLAAAYALCSVGLVDANLPLLMERLRDPERGMACSAAELLGSLGDRAKPSISALESAFQANRPGGNGDYHVGGACQNALRKIVPGWQPE